MSLRFAILGVLRSRDLHGYAVRTALGPLLSGFWPVNQSQVYATLKNLEEEELVRCWETPSHLSPVVRRMYSVTERGRTALRIWLDAPADTPSGQPRGFEDWLAHLAIYIHRRDRRGIALALEVQRQRCRSLLTIGPPPGNSGSPALAVSRAILQAELDWLEVAQRELLDEEPPEDQPSQPGSQ